MEITKDIIYVGVDDTVTDLFEGQFHIPDGISYNSYILLDEKIAVLDTVDKSFTQEWLDNIQKVLGTTEPDFLVIHHMEPDHSASIFAFMDKFKHTVLVASAKAFTMINQFFGTDYSDRRIIVGESDVLSLGQKELMFITAPMVHWPEVILSYEKTSGTLFSADAFGKFGIPDKKDNWVDEAGRYYIGIVGKYGPQVQALLKKAAGIDIKRICPLHGPILNENINYYVNLYDTWSSYRPEKNGVVIAYTSIYKNTEKAVLLLEKMLKDKGHTVTVYDLARCDMSKAVFDAFRYDKLVLATTTYNATIFPFMQEFINHLVQRNFQSRKIAIIENSSWAPMVEKTIFSMFSSSKNLDFSDCTVHIKSALSSQSLCELKTLADNL